MATIVETMSECFRKTFLFFAYVVASAGTTAYSFYLIWLIAYITDNGYYWFLAFLPGISIIVPILLARFAAKKWDLAIVLSLGLGVVMLLLFSFFTLTRQAYFHLSTDDFIGPKWVIMSLKGSIIFFFSGFLAVRECRLDRIFEAKDILSRALLDFVDIFNLLELLSLNKCVGIGSSVTEGSTLEEAIQLSCMSSIIIIYIPISTLIMKDDEDDTNRAQRLEKAFKSISRYSVFFQNIPFLIIRIIVWVQYDVFSLGFMVKNITAIVVGIAVIGRKLREANVEQSPEPNNENPDPPV